MFRPRSLMHLACFAALTVVVIGCATQRTADDIAMQRAYETKVSVTGSRVRRKVDPETGAPSVGYQVTTINGEAARMMLRDR